MGDEGVADCAKPCGDHVMSCDIITAHHIISCT